jgi:hypothetical protein
MSILSIKKIALLSGGAREVPTILLIEREMDSEQNRLIF